MLVNTLLITAVLVCIILFSSSASSSTVDALSVTFNNGSTLTLQASYFTGTFSQMQQNGISPGPHDWEMSLVTPSTFSGNCPSAQYMAQGKTCDEAKFGTAAYSATPNSDGSGIQIIFKATNSGNPWQASLDIVCDPSKNTLFSPTNAYSASQPSTDIIVSWTLKSKGACLGAGPAPGPAPGPGNNGGDDDKKSGGLTWGGVFLIIFFVPLGLYVIGFVAWNYKQGMTGKDLAPHPEFWGSLPGLCKDGVTFLWSKIRGTEWTPSEAGSSGGGGGSESAAGAGASGGYAAV